MSKSLSESGFVTEEQLARVIEFAEKRRRGGPSRRQGCLSKREVVDVLGEMGLEPAAVAGAFGDLALDEEQRRLRSSRRKGLALRAAIALGGVGLGASLLYGAIRLVRAGIAALEAAAADPVAMERLMIVGAKLAGISLLCSVGLALMVRRR
jgi:hypothetical protein